LDTGMLQDTDHLLGGFRGMRKKSFMPLWVIKKGGEKGKKVAKNNATKTQKQQEFTKRNGNERRLEATKGWQKVSNCREENVSYGCHVCNASKKGRKGEG
jgi:hypothetical protein